MAYRFLEDTEQPSQESTPSKVGRGIARNIFNVGTRVAGSAGDIASLLPESGKTALHLLTGKKIRPTEELRSPAYKATGEYLKPQSDLEKFTDDVIEDTSLLLLSPGKKAEGAINLFKSGIKKLGAALGANVVGKASEELGASEEGASAAKSGTLLALSLFNRSNASKHVGELYSKVEKTLPSTAKVDASRLNNNLKSLEKVIKVGRKESVLAPSEKFVLDEIKKIRDVSKSGQAKVSQLIAQKRSLNEQLVKHIFENPTKEAKGRAKHLAKRLNGWLREEIQDYGKSNKDFGQAFKDAEGAQAAIAQTQWIGRAAEKLLNYKPGTQGLEKIFGIAGGITGIASKGASALPAIGGSVAAYKSAQLAARIYKSPALRQHYVNALKAASQDNATVFNKEIRKLDEGLMQEDSKPRYVFID